MGSKLYVGGLPYSVTGSVIVRQFRQFSRMLAVFGRGAPEPVPSVAEGSAPAGGQSATSTSLSAGSPLPATYEPENRATRAPRNTAR
jgi:hypothetical protein